MYHQANELRYESIGHLLVKYSIPAVIGTLSVALYNIVDRIFIGQGVSALAISGLALTFPIMTILQAFGVLVSAGAASRISLALGRKDIPTVKKIVGNTLVLTVIFWFLLCCFGLTFLDQILYAFGASDNTLPFAKSYLVVIIPAFLFNNFSTTFASIIRASGFPKKSLQIVLIGVLLNIILDPIFIFGFKMGIQGAAVATAVSMLTSSGFVLRYFFYSTNYFELQKSHVKLEWSIVKQILSIGASPFTMSLIGSSVVIVVNRLLSEYGGDYAIGAYGIVSTYAYFFIMIVSGLCQGMQPIVGYNYGAGNLKRVMKALRMTAIIAFGVNAIICLLSIFAPTYLAAAFTSDAAMISVTKEGLFFTFLLFPLVGAQVVTSNFFQYIGKAYLSIILSLCRQVAFLLPGLFLMSKLLNLRGIWIAYPIADALSILLTAFILVVQIRIIFKRFIAISELRKHRL